jgi:hypothetical protein
LEESGGKTLKQPGILSCSLLNENCTNPEEVLLDPEYF